MPINPYFNFYNNEGEQHLLEGLMNEAINIFGFTGYYIPIADGVVPDLLYGDSPLKKFDNSYQIPMRLSNQIDPGMNNDFFSKFGLEIKNNIRVQLTKREFSRNVPQDFYNRPKEGDLIYIPHLSGVGELYEIKYTNDSTDKFSLGRKEPFYWELELELFKYNSEEINTGIEEIDIVEELFAYAIEYQLGVGAGDFELGETIYQSNDIYGTLQDWNKQTNVIKLTNIHGVFDTANTVIGMDTGASYQILEYDPMKKPQERDSWDNKVIEITSDPVINKEETNSFGSL